MSTEAEMREQLWYGVPFKQALQDVVARHQTGYTYEELKNVLYDPDNDDMLEEDELIEVDKQVNILLHMFVFYHSHSPEKETK